MEDSLRLTAFEQCINVKTGQDWWYNSRIYDFPTLRVRFYNRFIGKTPSQLWNQLRTAKRRRDKSVEEWGDRVDSMCEALNYNEPRMRYEFFLEGVRNKQLKYMLNASIVTTIRGACALQLFKDLNRPVEEVDEFAGEVKGPSAETSTPLKVLEQMQQMNLMLMQQQQQPRTESAPAHVSPVVPRSPRHSTVNTAVPRSQAMASTETAGQGSGVRRLNIKMGPATQTQQDVTVCGRCERRNCSRLT
jgi:hypothetical protein